ncbi:MAG: T9SS type A sorting domain-containing protein, partial [Bacteroidota bacterium]
YEGLDLFDFDGISAQYILITGLTNHGGSCFGLSEIRIDVAEEVIVANKDPLTPDCLSAKIFPNPVNENSRAIISNYCSNAPIHYTIQDITGRILRDGQINPSSNEMELDIHSFPMAAGTYILSLQQQDVVRRLKMMKVD